MAKQSKNNVIKQFDLMQELRAGFNPSFLDLPKKVSVIRIAYERTFSVVRFVEFGGMIVPIGDDIQKAMYPDNTDERCFGDLDLGEVFAKTEDGWLLAAVPRSLADAKKLAAYATGRDGMNPYHDPVEISYMQKFLSGNIRKLNGDEIGATYYPDFKHTFDSRDFLCVMYSFMDTTAEAIASVEAEYKRVVRDNERRDKQPKQQRGRASSAKVDFTQQEVCRRAMAAHECERAYETAKHRLINRANLYKAMWGIDRADFGDEFLRHFTRHAVADRRKAEHELKLAKKRLQTATAGYAAMIDKFGHDPFQKLYDRALALVADDARLPEGA